MTEGQDELLLYCNITLMYENDKVSGGNLFSPQRRTEKLVTRDLVKKKYTFEAIKGQPRNDRDQENDAAGGQHRFHHSHPGETGTGKASLPGPFMKKAIAATNLYHGKLRLHTGHAAESELFGYEEGAFTGARKGGKPGKFELAHEGTLFLMKSMICP